MKPLFLLSLTLMISQAASAYDNRCGSYPEPVGQRGACGDRALPSDKVRNVRNIRLECGSGVDHYVRTFVPFDFDKWSDLEDQDKRIEMQQLRLKEKPITWSGSIPYETTERWDWTDCVLGQAPVCGYHQECHDETSTYTDSNGKQQTKTERVCVDVMNTCYHDEEESETRYCSTERFEFNAAFAKPNTNTWKPGAKGYYDVIPNKYDLLPGEIEDVQVFSNSNHSTIISPSLEVGDAWNKYSPRIRIAETGSSQAACVFNKTYHADVVIETIDRIYGKNTPNAFRLPVDENGKELSPLKWVESQNKKNDFARLKPRQIELVDVSNTMITSMARQSRAFDVAREEAKAEAGKGGTQSAADYNKAKNAATQSGFWKNTEVRVRLKEITGFLARNIRPTHNLYTNSSSSSSNGSYDVNLMGSASSDNLYRASGPISDSWWDWKSVELKPKANYKLLISMYQEGVPFYKQAKGSNKENAFSKELEIPFSTDKNMDQRDLLLKFINFQGGR